MHGRLGDDPVNRFRLGHHDHRVAEQEGVGDGKGRGNGAIESQIAVGRETADDIAELVQAGRNDRPSGRSELQINAAQIVGGQDRGLG